MIKSLLVLACTALLVNARAENGQPLPHFKLPITAFTPQPATPDTLTSHTKPWSVNVSNAFTNSYYWRGFVFNQGLMAQPSVTVQKGDWQANVWSNQVMKETDGNAVVPEVDLTLSRNYNYKRFNVLPHVNVYSYPTNHRGTCIAELGADVSVDMDGVGFYASPNASVFGNRGGMYMECGFYRDGTLSKKLSYDTRFLLGWGNKSFYQCYRRDLPETKLPTLALQNEDCKNMRIQLSANYQLTNHASIQPQFIMFRNFMMEYAPLMQFNGSLALSYSF